MTDVSISNLDKAAILLNRLQPKSLDKVLEMLGPESSAKLRPIVAAVAKRPDYQALSDKVVQEFREIQVDVRAALVQAVVSQPPPPVVMATPPEPEPRTEADPEPASEADEVAESGEEEVGFKIPQHIVNPVAVLASLPQSMVGAALKVESPRVIAAVLKGLPTDVSGKILETFPSELRQSAFVLLAERVEVHPGVVDSLMRKIIDVCRDLNPDAVDEEDRRLKTMIGILQAVQRDERVRLMESLGQQDPELAARIDDAMYDYADVLRLDDRSIQKLLANLEQRVVAMALKTSPDQLRDKVLKNLSERVRSALKEEMSFLTSLSAAKVDGARKEIANVIRAQDKEGTLVWLE